MPENDTLRGLYPFLHGERQDPASLRGSLLHSVRRKAADSIAAKQRFFEASGETVVQAAEAIAAVYRRNGRMFSMGNGGSSCDAAHFAVEFQHPVTAGRPALTAVNLGSDTAMITAVGNDLGFRHVFLRQLVALARRDDGVIGFSTSGNSENILAAFAKAKQIGATTIALTGHDGGKTARSPDVDHCLVVPSESIHRIQEVHMTIYHILWDLVHTLLAEDRGQMAAP
ncbi:MAG: SIS domain-containing protein [Alphaproteobacteria bacterium]|nr:SIS domain-containing protein [Alphaproteobacteria bacterium]MBV8407641.1 SIS domain-containing protein [Alphaproteobacteria bacterium]